MEEILRTRLMELELAQNDLEKKKLPKDKDDQEALIGQKELIANSIKLHKSILNIA